ncbi:MAG: hypothetical protein F6J93_31875 [Oscillatoria sp. SIO1A7]|nr:hypothetical protein [Oscillatoria sp. SIO1A7]
MDWLQLASPIAYCPYAIYAIASPISVGVCRGDSRIAPTDIGPPYHTSTKGYQW